MVSTQPNSPLPLDTSLFSPGMRLGIGLSGGADSVALTRALVAKASELGLILHVAHLHHGLRGVEADADQKFVSALAESLGIPFHTHQVDTAAEAASNGRSRKPRETLEEAARRLRYAWFRGLLIQGKVDAIATAHTFDDQAETVLGKLLRGAWTEGLSGIHPVLTYPEGKILRPLLRTPRSQVEAYLTSIQQRWLEDSSNQDQSFTRNHLRHQLLPDLEQWNPKIREHLFAMATLARDEEAWWQSEIPRLAAQIILAGRPVRGGGRSVALGAESSTLALDVIRFTQLPAAIQRRLLRFAVATLGISLSFDATETLRSLAVSGKSGNRLQLPGSIAAERSARELRLTLAPSARSSSSADLSVSRGKAWELSIPGQTVAFGKIFHAEGPHDATPALIRNWKPGDRVTLRFSSGPRKVKEVLDRLKVSGSDREEWPVIEWKGAVVWMQGAELQPTPNLTLSVASVGA